ncbi:hypothetical protein SDC9_22915 [bioreactor metagenome]|uniref:Sporulation stage II protein D amidase enhancer LytB N-terminal domain-containing protein n=1 Tax=bioreactor metagenome TaxID=1076179 RepID=A0A644UDT5_9ZZZZ|nr:SpoIID/LytB domain-containing protein [Negativicutes bacterium]
MKTKYRVLYAVIALTIVVGLILSGCQQSPQKKETPAPPPHNQEDQQKEPEITVYMHDTGQKKTMKMEDYIAGVVAGEMKADWPIEALAAQAIIARTFTVQAIEEKGGVPERGTQASTDIKEFQAYNDKEVNNNVRRAVEMTRGLVVTYQGKPINSWFHASAGGITALAKEGLDYKKDEPPYIKSVQSPDDMAPADVKNWTVTFTKAEIMNVLAKQGKQVGSIDSFAIGDKGPSGRALTFAINNDIRVSAPEMRLGLGSTELKSLLLDKVEVKGESVVFTGKGYGHGVGMSQWGAHKMATEGKKPEEIIGHYFKEVTIEKRWQ